MNSSTHCIICGKKLLSTGCTFVKKRGIDTLCEYSKKYGDNKYKLLEGQSEIKIHEKCRVAYLVSKEVIVESSNSSDISTRSVSSSFEYNKLCLFCQKDYHQSIRKKCVISSDGMKEKLLAVSNLRNDSLGEQVRNLVSSVQSLAEVKARYHRVCFNDFNAIPTEKSIEMLSELEKSLKLVYDFIEDNLECQFVLSDLMNMMKYKPAPRTLVTNLEKHFGQDITITGVGLKSIVTYSGTGNLPIDDTWYLHHEQRKDDEHIRIIKTAAELIRKQVKSRQYKVKTYPSSVIFLENVQDDIPKYLNAFLEELIMFDVNKKKTRLNEKKPTDLAEDPELQQTDEDDTTKEDETANITSLGVKKDYIAHSIISAIRPKSFNSTLQLATGLYINRKSGSKLIVNLLSKLGVCASYHSVAIHELSAIKAEVTKIEKPCFTQYVFDNADHNPCTIDGNNTMHIMGGICCVAPKEAVCTGGEIPKLSKLPKASEIASVGAIELKDFPDQQTSLKSVTFLDVSGFKFGDVIPGITTVYSAHIWASYIKVNKLPSIRGLFDRIAKLPFYQVSRVYCLPFIDENPSDFRTIYTALHFAAEHCRNTERQTCFVTFDYPLYIKAKQILCNTKEEKLKNVIPRLGGFHLLMSFLKAIGTIMEGSGIFELFCTAFAQNSIDKMLSCTAYSRAIRAHMLAMNAIGQLIVEFAESAENINSHQYIEQVKEYEALEAPPPLMSITADIEDKKRTISNLFADLKNYPSSIDDVYSCNDAEALLKLLVSAIESLQRKSQTAQLWLQYFNCVTVALQFIEAERLGNWNLHLSCVKQMLPIFHAAGHSNYCKGAQIYLQDMINLEEIMDHSEFITFTEEGLFTVRRTDKAWSGIWSDMTIEQTLMRVLKTGAQSATHGRSVSDSVLSRFIQGMPYAYDVMDQLESFANSRCASSDQHTDVTSARQKKDEEDVKSFKTWLQVHGLFDDRPGKLMSLSTGLVADSTVDCHKAVEKGLQSMSKMVGVDAESYKFSKKNCVKTLASIKPVCVIDNEPITVNTSLLFQRIVAAMINNKNLVKTALLHELAPFPMSLFNDKGLMRESNKSELYKSLQFTTFVKPDPAEHEFVIDGGYLLHKVRWRKNVSCQQIFEDYASFIHNHYSTNAAIVFDGYNPENFGVKSYERYRRVREKTSQELKFTESMIVPRNKELFLSNIKNKARFVMYLITHLKKFTNLRTCQAIEDADTLIFHTALNIAEESGKKVIIVGTDVDLAALVIDLTPSDKYIALWKPKILKTPDVLYEANKNIKLKSILLFAHAFSGCDTVSSIFNKGKHSLLNLILKDPTLREEVDKFYKAQSTSDEIKEAGEKVMLQLFGSNEKSINECRIDRFSVSVTSAKSVNLATLPPTSSASHQHSLRTYYQVQTWLKNPLRASDWGWEKTETLFLPIKTTEPLAPSELLKLIHCSCTMSGCTKSCSCRKAGMKCTRACKGCKGENCTNASDIVDNINDHDEGGNNDCDDDEDDNFEYGMFVDQQNAKKPAYRKIIQGIFGSNSDSESDENTETEEAGVGDEEIDESRDQEQEEEAEEREEDDDEQETKNRPSKKGKRMAHLLSDPNKPGTSKTSPSKKRRKRRS